MVGKQGSWALQTPKRGLQRWALASAMLVLGCQSGPNAPAETGRAASPQAQTPPSEKGLPASAQPSAGVASPPGATGLAVAPAAARGSLFGTLRAPAQLISDHGGGIISNNGGGIISNNGGGVTNNQGSDLIGKTKFYELAQAAGGQAIAQLPVAGTVVELVDAQGEAIRDAAGQPLTTTTDAEGRFNFTATLPARNLIVRARLAADRGLIQAVATRDLRGEALNADLYSTVATAYILERYVAGQSDRQQVLDRLPGAVARETNVLSEVAFVRSGTTPPDRLDASASVALAEQLRQRDEALNQQFEKVRRILIPAGLSNQGEGLPATSVSLAMTVSLGEGPDGNTYFYDGRLWRVGPNGILATAMGGGTTDPSQAKGVPATNVNLEGSGISGRCFDDAGRLVLLAGDTLLALGPDGVVTVLAQFPWDNGRTLLGQKGGVYFFVSNQRWGESAKVVRLQQWRNGTYSEVATVPIPEGMWLGDVGFDPERGALLHFWAHRLTPTFVWVSLANGAATPWSPPWADVDAENPSPRIDAQGNLFYRASDTGLRVLRPGATAPLALGGWKGYYEEAALAADGASALVGSGGRLWRVTPTDKRPVAGLDPNAAVGGDGSSLALFEPVTLTAGDEGTLWLTDRVRGKLLMVSSEGKAQEVPLPGEGFKTALANSLRFPLLRPGMGKEVHLLGTLQAGLGIHRVRPDGSSTLLYSPPQNHTITDFAPLPDGSMLLLLDPREGGDLILKRRPDGGLETLFTAQTKETTYPIGNGQSYTHVESLPDLRDCDVMPGQAGEIWVYGRGRLARWRANTGFAVVRQASRFMRPEEQNDGVSRRGCVRGPDGAFYFTPGDPGNGSLSQLRRWDPVTGQESLVAGRSGSILGTAFNGTGADERLTDPHSPAFEASGDLVFLDTAARQVRRVPKDKLLGTPLPADNEEE